MASRTRINANTQIFLTTAKCMMFSLSQEILLLLRIGEETDMFCVKPKTCDNLPGIIRK
jgi:hypothetical protein